MQAKGTFEVDLTPQTDDGAPAGRMIIKKTYAGDMSGLGIGQMISKRTPGGTAVYYAIEEFTGEIQGKHGACTFVHAGRLDKESQSLQVDVLAGSGSGELESLSGSMNIIQDADGHSYELSFKM